MGNTFMESPKYLLASESVTEGHPDKVCDQISDAILDAIMKEDPMGRVACETAVTTGLVVVLGEITTKTYVDVEDVVRKTIQTIGYTNPNYNFDYQSCGVIVGIKKQSSIFFFAFASSDLLTPITISGDCFLIPTITPQDW